MNLRTHQNSIVLTSCCLLLLSTPVLADRPAMEDSAEAFNSEVIDISTDLEDVPVFEEMPSLKQTSEQNTGSRFEDDTADESRDQETPQADEAIRRSNTDNEVETTTTGDIIELESGDTIPVKIINFPSRGMSMNKVRNELGEPLEISDTIGQPPITSWSYNDRIVYFEHAHVVHVVAAH